MLISENLHKKISEVSIKTWSTAVSLSFKGQATAQATVKWSIEKWSCPSSQHNETPDTLCKQACKKFFATSLYKYVRLGTSFDLTSSQFGQKKKRKENNMFQHNKITSEVSSQL